MTQTYVESGEVVDLTAPSGGVTVGTPVQIGQLLVIPKDTAAEGESFTGMATGTHDLPKVGSQAWTEGALVYWDSSEAECTTTATSNLLIGCAVAAVGSGTGETTGRVRLNGAARANEAGA